MKMVFIICSLNKLEGQSLPGALLTSLSDGLAISIFRLTPLIFIMLKIIERYLIWQKSIDTGTKHRPRFEEEVNKMFKNCFTNSREVVLLIWFLKNQKVWKSTEILFH